MNELQIGAVLSECRHKQKVTQEELAEYLGVSKAAVSKWETGASYPDITLLPRLATFFHLSLEELLAYRPQLTREEIFAGHYQRAGAVPSPADTGGDPHRIPAAFRCLLFPTPGTGTGAVPAVGKRILLLFPAAVPTGFFICQSHPFSIRPGTGQRDAATSHETLCPSKESKPGNRAD